MPPFSNATCESCQYEDQANFDGYYTGLETTCYRHNGHAYVDWLTIARQHDEEFAILNRLVLVLNRIAAPTLELPPRKESPPRIKHQVTNRQIQQCYQDEEVEIWTPPSPMGVRQTSLEYITITLDEFNGEDEGEQVLKASTLLDATAMVHYFYLSDRCKNKSFKFYRHPSGRYSLKCATCDYVLRLPLMSDWINTFNLWLRRYGEVVGPNIYSQSASKIALTKEST